MPNGRLLRPRHRRDERMGMAAPLYYTADMVRAMPDDGNRYEVVYGELLVTPAPRPWHQVVVQRLSLALGNYLERQPVGLVLSSPADISWGPDVLVQPDVFVVPADEARTLTWSRMRTLLLVAEVLQPVVHQGRPVPQASAVPGGGRAALLGGGRRRADSVEVWTPADDFPASSASGFNGNPPPRYSRSPFASRNCSGRSNGTCTNPFPFLHLPFRDSAVIRQ